MAKRRVGLIAMILCLCLLPRTVFAASTADAKETIATDRACSLNVSYRCDGNAFDGQSVKLYKIAEVSGDARYTLTPDFGASGLILNGIQTNGEWNVIRSTLEGFILANKVAPELVGVTDEKGEVRFDGLEPGLYLTSGVRATQGDLTYAFASALVAMPGLSADGYWQYEVSVAAKPRVIPPSDPDQDISYKVLKLWKGDEDLPDRPIQIEVEIFCNGSHFKTVILSEENHWSYSWTAKNDGANWAVAERNVPEGYRMTMEERGTTFVLTNVWVSDDPDAPINPPPTGDTSNIYLYAVLMFASGAMLIILGMTGKRKRHEETT